jgi:hypothetical protein
MYIYMVFNVNLRQQMFPTKLWRQHEKFLQWYFVPVHKENFQFSDFSNTESRQIRGMWPKSNQWLICLCFEKALCNKILRILRISYFSPRASAGSVVFHILQWTNRSLESLYGGFKKSQTVKYVPMGYGLISFCLYEGLHVYSIYQ